MTPLILPDPTGDDVDELPDWERELLSRQAADSAAAEGLARRFHETYERLAPSFGYETREASAKPWADVPERNRALMIAVCGEILGPADHADRLVAEPLNPMVTVANTTLPTLAELDVDGNHPDVEKLILTDEAHRRGFEHGQRWAAEELVRIATREGQLESWRWWHVLGGEALTGIAGELGRRVLAAIPPPTPEPSAPRVWAMPKIPEDVRAVVGHRAGREHVFSRVGSHWTSPTVGGAWRTDEILTEFGPLTEVTTDDQ